MKRQLDVLLLVFIIASLFLVSCEATIFPKDTTQVVTLEEDPEGDEEITAEVHIDDTSIKIDVIQSSKTKFSAIVIDSPRYKDITYDWYVDGMSQNSHSAEFTFRPTVATFYRLECTVIATDKKTGTTVTGVGSKKLTYSPSDIAAL